MAPRLALTAGSVSIVSEIALIKAALDARLLPHLADLGHAELRVGAEEELSRPDGEIVLLPVPEVLELVVVERGEGVHAGRQTEGRVSGSVFIGVMFLCWFIVCIVIRGAFSACPISRVNNKHGL